MAETSTHEHRPPASPAEDKGRPALVCAFPSPLAVPIPGGVLGRAWLDAIRLSDPEVSKEHARITRRPGGAIEVADAGSRNGTFVDGARLASKESVALRDGSLLRIGRTVFVFRAALRGPLAPSPPLGAMIGPYGLRDLERTLTRWSAQPPATALILGETGTGKELAAQEIATRTRRAPLVAVNLGAIASGVFESQLFGHTAGAFSDAKRAARGVFLAAAGGAVFLDEMGDLPLELQPKLLRVLENREVQPVGAERPEKVDVLVIAATHQDLAAMVETGRFRRDLFARLSMAVARLPALRERPEDLFSILVAVAAAQGHTLRADQCEVEAIERLLLHPWPGNVRELAALYARLGVHDPAGGVALWTLERELPGRARDVAPISSVPGSALTRDRIDDALARAGGNESEAARILGVSRGALRRSLGKG